MDRRVWLSRRALKLHAVIIIVVPGFLALCVWQILRATGGNELSWAYVFEWPFFAGYAVYMWWRIVHETPDMPAATATASANGARARSEAAPGQSESVGAPTPRTGVAGDTAVDAEDAEADPELAAYNAYLAQLAARDRAAGR